MRAGKRQQAGQAIVEMALGSLVFVTVLVFGIHFAEVGYIALQTQEAEAFARWEVTGRKASRPPNDFGPRTTAINNVGAQVSARYADFDGRTSTTGGTTLTQVFTRGTGLNVTCQEEGLAPLGLPDSLEDVFSNGNGGVSCIAQANLALVRFPVNFLNESGSGIFTVANAAQLNLTICAVGRSWGLGGCQGRIPMLVGDWGLADGAESAQCPVQENPCDSPPWNEPYHDMVERAFNDYGAGFTSLGANVEDLARFTLGEEPPVSVDDFFMSFRGEEDPPGMQGPFQDEVPGNHINDDPYYTTTPGGEYEVVGEYQEAHGERTDCFLGIDCNQL